MIKGWDRGDVLLAVGRAEAERRDPAEYIARQLCIPVGDARGLIKRAQQKAPGSDERYESPAEDPTPAT